MTIGITVGCVLRSLVNVLWSGWRDSGGVVFSVIMVMGDEHEH